MLSDSVVGDKQVTFCLRAEQEPIPITAAINGPRCTKLLERTAATAVKKPSAPVPASRLCASTADASELFDPDRDIECARTPTAVEGIYIYHAAQEGDEYHFLIQQEPSGFVSLALLATTHGGRGNMSGWLEGVEVSRREGEGGVEVIITYRTRHTDWDLGDNRFFSTGSCRRVTCRQGPGASRRLECGRSTALREYGGDFRVEPAPPGPGDWPHKPGAPVEQWDCRAGP